MKDKKYYDQDSLWGNPPEPYQVQVRSDILHLLPEEVVSVLDLGCGDGFITNALPERLHTVAMDISEEALQYARNDAVIGSITDIPFPDKAFDLVMANDVLEHLPDDEFQAALQEMQRIAGKYILVTVPFMENLAAGRTFCAVCGKIYHINHHHRAFDFGELARLLAPSFVPTVFVLTGDQAHPRDVFLRNLRSKTGLLTNWDRAVCPHCGSNASMHSGSGDLRAAMASIAGQFPVMDYSFQPDRTECIALYQAPPAPDDSVQPASHPSIHLSSRLSRESGRMDSRLEYNGQSLVLVHADASDSMPPEAVWIEWRFPGFSCYYSNPERLSAREYLVPSWVSAQMHGKATAALSVFEQKAEALFLLAMSFITEKINLKSQTGIALQNARAELDILKKQLGQAEQREVDLQNARAELDILKQRLGRAEQLEVDLQNARAELDILKKQFGQAEQREVDLQNARAELDILKQRLGRAEQLEVDLQNARAELDILKKQLGQAEQREVDLQNARAELQDLQNARAGLQSDLETVKARLAEAEALLSSRTGMLKTFVNPWKR